MQYLLLFHGKNIYANAPQRYVIRPLHLFLWTKAESIGTKQVTWISIRNTILIFSNFNSTHHFSKSQTSANCMKTQTSAAQTPVNISRYWAILSSDNTLGWSLETYTYFANTSMCWEAEVAFGVWAEKAGHRIPIGPEDLFYSRHFRTGYGAHSAFTPMNTEVNPWNKAAEE